MEQNQQSQPPVFNPQEPAQQPAPQYQPRVSARPMMDPVEAVKTCFKKFFDFTGRARRSEYWWFVLFTVIVSTIFSFLGGFLPVLTIIGMVVSLVLTIPQMSALTRRLHDTGRSGWWVLLFALAMLVVYGALIYVLYPYAGDLMGEGDSMALAGVMADAFGDAPGVAGVMVCASLVTIFFWLITLIFSVLDSKWGENKYGPSPKYQ